MCAAEVGKGVFCREESDSVGDAFGAGVNYCYSVVAIMVES